MKKPFLFGVLLTVSLFIVAFVFAQIYPEGMISYWKFDELSGSTAIDSVNGNHGTIHGANRTAGIVDRALSFDGLNDYVRISHSPSVNLGTTDFTLEAWIKTLDSDGNIFFHYDSGGYYFVVSGGKLLGAVRRVGGYYQLFSNDTVNDGHWHHVVFIRHYNEKVELYIDGQFDNSRLETAGNLSISVPLDLGRDTVHGHPWFEGIIDEAAIYSRALTAEEIQQHYQNGLNGGGYEVPFECDSQSQIPQTECEALVALYENTVGPEWSNDTNWLVTDPCDWYGIWCDSSAVAEVNLPDNNLVGTIPSEMGGLRNLVFLDLSGNTLTGPIPVELVNLGALQFLHLNDNRLTGEIPIGLGDLSGLIYLTLHANWLRGPIPSELGKLSNLAVLQLNHNFLSGEIPPELGDLGNLFYLGVQNNWLTGAIPRELGNLSNLDTVFLNHNQLDGGIPTELGNLSNLQGLILSHNLLSGPIPAELGNLSNLEWLSLADNQLSGTIPPELGNLGNVQRLSVEFNLLGGEIPPELGDLGNLLRLELASNQLIGEIPREFGNLSNLESLHIYMNQLSGEIPAELGNLSSLKDIHAFSNQLAGKIPRELGNLSNLETLHLGDNQLNGKIPPELGNLNNLQNLWLNSNELSGEIPAELGNLYNLENLWLDSNQLSGEIPAELGNFGNLQQLLLHDNELSGQVPISVATLGGAEPLANNCELMPGNWGLYMPDTQPYRDADQDLDGFICGLPITDTVGPTHDPVKEVTNLGTLGGFSVARAVNDNGVVVGGSITTEEDLHPFYWTEEDGMQDMGTPEPGLQCEARSIDRQGSMGVGRCCAVFYPEEVECEGIGERAFYWAHERKTGFFFPNNSTDVLCETAVAFGSISGVFVGGCQYEPGLPILAVIGLLSDFRLFPGMSLDCPSVATAINMSTDKKDPPFVAGILVTEAGNSHAFLYPGPDTGTVQDLGTLGGNWSDAWAVNGKGEVAGASETADGEQHAFLWTPTDGMIDLGTLGGGTSSALGMNDDSEVVGYSTTTWGQTVAFLWTPDNGMVALRSLEGAGDWGAWDINNKGIVVGATRFEGPSDNVRATMWVLK